MDYDASRACKASTSTRCPPWSTPKRHSIWWSNLCMTTWSSWASTPSQVVDRSLTCAVDIDWYLLHVAVACCLLYYCPLWTLSIVYYEHTYCCCLLLLFLLSLLLYSCLLLFWVDGRKTGRAHQPALPGPSSGALGDIPATRPPRPSCHHSSTCALHLLSPSGSIAQHSIPS